MVYTCVKQNGKATLQSEQGPCVNTNCVFLNEQPKCTDCKQGYKKTQTGCIPSMLIHVNYCYTKSTICTQILLRTNEVSRNSRRYKLSYSIPGEVRFSKNHIPLTQLPFFSILIINISFIASRYNGVRYVLYSANIYIYMCTVKM